MALQEFKCPNCGGSVEFNSDSQKLQCPYCDTEFDIDALTSHEEILNTANPDKIEWDSAGGTEWAENDQAGLKSYICNSCGGEIIADDTLGATSCPYCDNPVVISGNFSGKLKPDFVIPFKLDKAAAKEALYKHFSGKKLLPKVFSDRNHIDEIKGVYVPFWIFDAGVDADVRYKATRIRAWSDSDYNYTETTHYGIYRTGNVRFANVPVDGSTKMADDLMESIEPFDMKDAVDFNTAYLAGYLADKYDVDAAGSVDRANTRIKSSTEQEFAGTVQGYASVVPESSTVNLSSSSSRYALLPVWILNTSWNGQKFTFAMNGQTGKIVGNLPMDKGIYYKYLLSVGLGAAAAAFGVFYALTMLL